MARAKGEKPQEKQVTIKILKIDSCLECPHHGIERDPSSGDGFDWLDNSLVCYAAKERLVTKSDLGGYGWKAPARRILAFCRDAEAEYKRNGLGIPKWCPL